MNRRSFIELLAAGTAGFAILPGAGRIWIPNRVRVLTMPVLCPLNVNDYEDFCLGQPLPRCWPRRDISYVAAKINGHAAFAYADVGPDWCAIADGMIEGSPKGFRPGDLYAIVDISAAQYRRIFKQDP